MKVNGTTSFNLAVQLVHARLAIIFYLAYPVHVPHDPVVGHLVANPAPGYPGLVVVVRRRGYRDCRRKVLDFSALAAPLHDRSGLICFMVVNCKWINICVYRL